MLARRSMRCAGDFSERFLQQRDVVTMQHFHRERIDVSAGWTAELTRKRKVNGQDASAGVAAVRDIGTCFPSAKP